MTAPNMTRRLFCATAPATPLTLAVPAHASVNPATDPAVGLVAEWYAAHRTYEAESHPVTGSGEDGPECARAWDRMLRVEDELETCTPTTPAGIAAMIELVLKSSHDLACTGPGEVAMLRRCLEPCAALTR